MRALLRFLATLLSLAIVVLLLVVILDMTRYAHDPANATAYAVVTSLRNLFPADWIEQYDIWRAAFLNWLPGVLDTAHDAA